MTARPLRAVFLAFLLSTVTAGPSNASFQSAVQAFDAGAYATAAAQWRSLAVTCDLQAQTALADLFRIGLGVPQSDVHALRWYLLAAWAGERYAQQASGDAYARGEGVPADSVRAAFWLTLAADQGLNWSAGRRDEIVSALSQTARDLLEDRLAAYRPTLPSKCRSGR